MYTFNGILLFIEEYVRKNHSHGLRLSLVKTHNIKKPTDLISRKALWTILWHRLSSCVLTIMPDPFD